MKTKLIKLRLYRVYFKSGYMSNERVYNLYLFRNNSKYVNMAMVINRDSKKDDIKFDWDCKYIMMCGENIKDVIDQLIEVKNAIKDIVEVNNCICKVIRKR